MDVDEDAEPAALPDWASRFRRDDDEALSSRRRASGVRRRCLRPAPLAGPGGPDPGPGGRRGDTDDSSSSPPAVSRPDLARPDPRPDPVPPDAAPAPRDEATSASLWMGSEGTPAVPRSCAARRRRSSADSAPPLDGGGDPCRPDPRPTKEPEEERAAAAAPLPAAVSCAGKRGRSSAPRACSDDGVPSASPPVPSITSVSSSSPVGGRDASSPGSRGRRPPPEPRPYDPQSAAVWSPSPSESAVLPSLSSLAPPWRDALSSLSCLLRSLSPSPRETVSRFWATRGEIPPTPVVGAVPERRNAPLSIDSSMATVACAPGAGLGSRGGRLSRGSAAPRSPHDLPAGPMQLSGHVVSRQNRAGRRKLLYGAAGPARRQQRPPPAHPTETRHRLPAMAARSRAWLTRVASAGAGILIIGVALGNRAMTDQSGTKHR